MFKYNFFKKYVILHTRIFSSVVLCYIQVHVYKTRRPETTIITQRVDPCGHPTCDTSHDNYLPSHRNNHAVNFEKK